jgi:hypothetical protein
MIPFRQRIDRNSGACVCYAAFFACGKRKSLILPWIIDVVNVKVKVELFGQV